MEAAGRLGMSEIEFELTTPRYFHHRLKGFDALQIEHWKRSRWVAYYAFKAYAADKNIKPADLFALPGDRPKIPEGEARRILAERLKEAVLIDWWGDKAKAES